MDCQQFQNQWVEVEEGTLSPQEKRDWELHRQICAACRKEMELFQVLQNQLRGIPPASPLPPVFWSRQTDSILKKINETPRRRWTRLWESLFQPRVALTAAALTLLLFFGIRFLGPRGPLKGSQEQWALQRQGSEDDVDFSDTEEKGSEWDLTEEQVDQYYATLAQKYLPASENEDEGDEKIWIEDLDEKQLNQAIEILEKKTGRRTL